MVFEFGQWPSVWYLMTHKLWWAENSLKLFLVVYNLDTDWTAQNYDVNSQFIVSGPFGDQSGEHAIVRIRRSQVKGVVDKNL